MAQAPQREACHSLYFAVVNFLFIIYNNLLMAKIASTAKSNQHIQYIIVLKFIILLF